MLGTSAQAFDMTLEYLKAREQFGRVIGSFQTLGHRAAMLFSAMELARSCVEGALLFFKRIDVNWVKNVKNCSKSLIIELLWKYRISSIFFAFFTLLT